MIKLRNYILIVILIIGHISEENLAGVLKDGGKLGLCEWQN